VLAVGAWPPFFFDTCSLGSLATLLLAQLWCPRCALYAIVLAYHDAHPRVLFKAGRAQMLKKAVPHYCGLESSQCKLPRRDPGVPLSGRAAPQPLRSCRFQVNTTYVTKDNETVVILLEGEDAVTRRGYAPPDGVMHAYASPCKSETLFSSSLRSVPAPLFPLFFTA
jgi:hypothetical protein